MFDTGSTNTWILNKNTKLSTPAEKALSYDDEASSSSKKTKQAALITFGSGKLGGHFYTDDIRIGECDGKESNG